MLYRKLNIVHNVYGSGDRQVVDTQTSKTIRGPHRDASPNKIYAIGANLINLLSQSKEAELKMLVADYPDLLADMTNFFEQFRNRDGQLGDWRMRSDALVSEDLDIDDSASALILTEGVAAFFEPDEDEAYIQDVCEHLASVRQQYESHSPQIVLVAVQQIVDTLFKCSVSESVKNSIINWNREIVRGYLKQLSGMSTQHELAVTDLALFFGVLNVAYSFEDSKSGRMSPSHVQMSSARTIYQIRQWGIEMEQVVSQDKLSIGQQLAISFKYHPIQMGLLRVLELMVRRNDGHARNDVFSRETNEISAFDCEDSFGTPVRDTGTCLDGLDLCFAKNPEGKCDFYLGAASVFCAVDPSLVVGDKRVSFTAIKTAFDTLGKRPDLVRFVHDVSSIKYGERGSGLNPTLLDRSVTM